MRQTGSPENRDYLEELRGSNSFVKVAARGLPGTREPAAKRENQAAVEIPPASVATLNSDIPQVGRRDRSRLCSERRPAQSSDTLRCSLPACKPAATKTDRALRCEA